MSRQRRFIQCDVFTEQPTRGNGLAVVLDGEGLSDETMQRFATWTNLAETTFLFPPEDAKADYRVRIFTTTRELPFAGHPTLGSCMSWLAAGGRPATPGRVIQDCGVGLVEIDIGGGMPAFVAPATKIEDLSEAFVAELREALSLPREAVKRSARLDNGPLWAALELDSAARVLAVRPTRLPYPDYVGIGLIAAHPPGAAADFEVRMLEPPSGQIEDPITGSLNAALAHWLYGLGAWRGPKLIHQGTVIGRAGRVHIRQEGERIWVGGAVQMLIEGTLTL